MLDKTFTKQKLIITHQRGRHERRNRLKVPNGAGVRPEQEVDPQEEDSQQAGDSTTYQAPDDVLPHAGRRGSCWRIS